MKNKVLVKIYVPELDFDVDLFIPVNELLWKIKLLAIQAISEMSGGALRTDKEYILINKQSSFVYRNNSTIIDTDIRNATELVLISKKTD